MTATRVAAMPPMGTGAVTGVAVIDVLYLLASFVRGRMESPRLPLSKIFLAAGRTIDD
jgi:hypothetical protein